MANCLQVPMMAPCSVSSSSTSVNISRRTFCSMRPRNASKIPMPPINPKDPFLKKLASVAADSPESLLNRPVHSDTPPYLDLFDSPQLMATPAQVCFFSGISIYPKCLIGLVC